MSQIWRITLSAICEKEFNQVFGAGKVPKELLRDALEELPYGDRRKKVYCKFLEFLSDDLHKSHNYHPIAFKRQFQGVVVVNM